MASYVLHEDLASLVEVQPETIASRTFHKEGHARAVLFAFDTGQELTEHTSSHAAIIQILQGRARIALGDDVHNLTEGAWLYMPPQLPHSVYAETPLKMLLILLEE
ncbi:MAG: cupin domain-containing protein [Chloroflexi bacterium]|nr:MAG: cupin domain-containing protein [Chloroflexota bacterium]